MNEIMIKERNLIIMLLLMLLTCGLYFFYWQYKTKQEINALGGTIPTFWFAVLPFFNIYFDYRYAQEFVKYIRKSDQAITTVLLFFIVLLIIPLVGALIVQYELNNYARLVKREVNV